MNLHRSSLGTDSSDVSEEQLGNVFSEVGPVQNVEIKFDPQTNKSKGYAFVHYYDPETASSAVRNLHQVEVNGRNLRVELSTDEPPKKRRQMAAAGGGANGTPAPAGGYGYNGRSETPPAAGRFGYGSTPVPGGPGSAGPAPGPGGQGGYAGPPGGGQTDIDLSQLPSGVDLPPGQKATDAISKTLAAIPPGQMQEIMAGMKTLIATQPDQARQILHQKPQLAYALFQAMLLLNIVDPSVLQRIKPVSAPPAQGPPPPGPGYGYPSRPPGPSGPPAPHAPGYPPYQPPAQYNRPPAPADPRFAAPPPVAAPPAPQIPPHAMAQLATLPQDQRDMLMQVLSMTPDQIAGLDTTQRQSVMQLRAQFLG